jgi:hypothetical protein
MQWSALGTTSSGARLLSGEIVNKGSHTQVVLSNELLDFLGCVGHTEVGLCSEKTAEDAGHDCHNDE